MKGRVLILTGATPTRPGGVEHFVRELSVALQNRGYSTEVSCIENSMPAGLRSRGGKIGRLIASNLCGFFVARNARRKLGPDVAAVVSNGDLGWCAPGVLGAKRIHMYHGTYRAQAEAIRPLISHRGYLYLKWWCCGALERLGGRKRLVLCNSNQTCEEISRFFGFNGTVVWLPLDCGIFRQQDRVESRRQLGLSTDASWGLFVGSTNPAKGFDRLRQMMDGLPDVHWIVVVSGEVPSDLQSISRVKVFRDLSEQQLPPFYGAADFMVCPSYYESFGYVVAEALACGTPTIASPGGASREFLKDAPLDQLLIPNPWSLERALGVARRILSAPEYYRQKVNELVRPRLVELASPENWARRFFEVTGL